MALNKTETVSLGTKDGNIAGKRLIETRSLTYEVLNALEWNERTKLAAEASADIVVPATVPVKWHSDYRDAVRSAIVKKLDEVLRSGRAAREMFAKACRGISYEKALEEIEGIVKEFNVRGGRTSRGYHSIRLNVVRGRDISGDIEFHLERNWKALTNPDNPQQAVGTFTFSTKLSFSGTTRTLASSLAHVAMYQELCTVGAEVEARMERLNIIWTEGYGGTEAPVIEEWR